MTLTIYETCSYADFKRTGKSFVVHLIPDDNYVAKYPYTSIPVPDELTGSDKVPFFNFQTCVWEDKSTEAEIAAAKKQQDDLTTTKQDAADAKATVTAQAATIASLTKQLTETTDAIVELAQATLPSSDANTTTKQEAAQ